MVSYPNVKNKEVKPVFVNIGVAEILKPVSNKCSGIIPFRLVGGIQFLEIIVPDLIGLRAGINRPYPNEVGVFQPAARAGKRVAFYREARTIS